MNELGGYLDFEFQYCASAVDYTRQFLAVNTARNALEYILKAENYSKLYIPYFTCDVILEPLRRLKIAFEFYSIDEELYPIFDFDQLQEQEAFLYTNYFGVNDKNVERIALACKNLIIDNAQAFFYKCSHQVPAFYSPRKFFGVPDGGFILHQKKMHDFAMETDVSYHRFTYLLGRAEFDAKKFYNDFKENELELCHQHVKHMSVLTKKMLSSINYSEIKIKRTKNFQVLHQHLNQFNLFQGLNLHNQGPLCYPFLVKDGASIKQKLIDQQVFVPTYWPNVFEWTASTSLEYKLSENLVCLPIDQRYEEKDMHRIINIINTGK
jgi:hypothetical protein